MRLFLLISPTIVLMLLFFSCLDVVADDAEILRQRFEQGVADTEQELKKLSFRITCRSYNEILAGPSAKDGPRLRTDSDKGVELTSLVRGPYFKKISPGGESVSNSVYSFHAKNMPDNGKFFLMWVSKHGVSKQDDQIVSAAQRKAVVKLSTAYFIGKTIAEWLRSPYFKMKNIGEVDIDGRKLVRIDFEHRDPNEIQMYLVDSYFICDPQAHWAIREVSFTNKAHAVIRAVNVFDSKSDQFPVPTEHVTTLEVDNEIWQRNTLELTALSRDPIPDEEFYLSHYGLPEPNFESEFKKLVATNSITNNAWLFYIFLGVIFSAGAYFLRRQVPLVN